MPRIKLLESDPGLRPNQENGIDGVTVVHPGNCGCGGPAITEITTSGGGAYFCIVGGVHVFQVQESDVHQALVLPGVQGDPPAINSPIGTTVLEVPVRPLLRNDVKLTYRLTVVENGAALPGLIVSHNRALCRSPNPPQAYPGPNACSQAAMTTTTDANGQCEFNLYGAYPHYFQFFSDNMTPPGPGLWRSIQIDPTAGNNNCAVIERTVEWEDLAIAALPSDNKVEYQENVPSRVTIWKEDLEYAAGYLVSKSFRIRYDYVDPAKGWKEVGGGFELKGEQMSASHALGLGEVYVLYCFDPELQYKAGLAGPSSRIFFGQGRLNVSGPGVAIADYPGDLSSGCGTHATISLMKLPAQFTASFSQPWGTTEEDHYENVMVFDFSCVIPDEEALRGIVDGTHDDGNRFERYLEYERQLQRPIAV